MQQIAAQLPLIVADPRRPRQVTHDELIQRLGWRTPSGIPATHEFSSPDHYEPIEGTETELKRRLSELSGGYIALLGSPGSGKSTLLTETLLRMRARAYVIRYYAFVPAPGPYTQRGESERFLTHMVKCFDDIGIQVGRSVAQGDRDALLERFHQQLMGAGQKFQRTGIPTVILVDGLDHIDREQNPVRSLVADLPSPSDIPDGVFIVLGTQTARLAGMPNAVRVGLASDGRQIQMAPMTPDAAMRVVDASAVATRFSEAERNSIIELAGGHPLVLTTIIRLCEQSEPTERADDLIGRLEAYAGDLDEYYARHWTRVEDNRSIRDLLSLLARLRRPIDLEWVATWADRDTLDALRKDWAHFFRPLATGRWAFFHNSFRLFVLDKSNDRTDQQLHDRIAALVRVAPMPLRCEELYHLSRAGQGTRVLEIATAEYFREQVFSFRPVAHVIEDTCLAAEEAANSGDARSLVRLALAAKELFEREFNLDDWSIARQLIELGEHELAQGFLFEGDLPVLGVERSFLAASLLNAAGQIQIARRLFETAESELKLKSRRVGDDGNGHGARDEWYAWARAVPRFRAVDEILADVLVSQVPQDPSFSPPTAEEHRDTLVCLAANACWQLGRGDDAVELCSARWGPREHQGWPVGQQLRLVTFAAARGEGVEARMALEELLGSYHDEVIDNTSRIEIAFALYRRTGNASRLPDLLPAIEPPKLKTHSFGSLSARDLLDVYRYYRLIFATGTVVDSSSAIPNASRPDDWPLVLGTRALVDLARISAHADIARGYTAGELIGSLQSTLHLYSVNNRRISQYHGWHDLDNLRAELINLLVSVVSQHGMAAIETLRDQLGQMWRLPERGRAWPPTAVRCCVRALYRLGVDREWCKSQLEHIGRVMLDGGDISQHLVECEEQAKAWLDVGEKERAFEEVRRYVESGIGIGYRKDYQLENWLQWLEVESIGDRDSWTQWIARFAACVSTAYDETEGRGAHIAALELLRRVAASTPELAMPVLMWLEDQHCVVHSAAVAKMLQGALASDPDAAPVLSVVLSEILLPISSESHAMLAGDVASALASSSDPERARTYLEKLVWSIDRYAIDRFRIELRRSVKPALGPLGVHVDWPDLSDTRAEEKNASYDTSLLRLSDGSELSSTEVISRCTSPEALIETLGNAFDSYYDWAPVLRDLLRRFTVPEVRYIAENLPRELNDPTVFVFVGEYLVSVGVRATARRLAERAIGLSREFDWSIGRRGRSIVTALELICKADPIGGPTQVMQEIARGLRSDPRAVALSLHSLVPLMDSGLSRADVLPFVCEHIEQLGKHSGREVEVHDRMRSSSEATGVAGMAWDLLQYHMADNVTALSHRADAGLITLLADTSVDSDRLAKCLDSRSSLERAGAIRVLAIASMLTPRVIARYVDQLRELQHSENWCIASTAAGLIGLDLRDCAANRIARPLSPAYRLVMPELTEASQSPLSPDEPLPETSDPQQLVGSCKFILEDVAFLTGISSRSLCFATAQKMGSLTNAGVLAETYERRYKNRLGEAELKMAFRRPRSMEAREAIQRTVGDLVDAGEIQEEHLDQVTRLVRFDDPVLGACRPARSPEEVGGLTGIGDYGEVDSNWISDCEHPAELFARKVGKRVVLAEATTVRLLSWNMPAEVRWSVVSIDTGASLASSCEPVQIEELQLELYAEIADGAVPNDPDALVIRNSWVTCDTEGAAWIGINPVIARSMGWVHDGLGLCRWVDPSGSPMVETIWWVDGNIDRRDRLDGAVVGEGWLCVATAEAFSALKDRLCLVFRRGVTVREMVRDGRIARSHPQTWQEALD